MIYKFKNGGVIKLQTAWTSIPRKEQKKFDNVTQELLNDFNKQQSNISTNGGFTHRMEEPLKDEHPELDLALITAQPGSILTKLMAPSMARGMIDSIRNRDVQQVMMPWIGKVKYAGHSRKANIAREIWFNKQHKYFDEGLAWETSRRPLGELSKEQKKIRNMYMTRAEQVYNLARKTTQTADDLTKINNFYKYRDDVFNVWPNFYEYLNKGGKVK